MRQKVKVLFALNGDPLGGESVWAEEVGHDLYCLMNIPFYARGYAKNDIVRCAIRKHDRGDEEWEEVVELVEDSGNGTIRLLFADGTDSSKIHYVLRELVSIGCSYELASRTYASVNVPGKLELPFSHMINYLNGQPKKYTYRLGSVQEPCYTYLRANYYDQETEQFVNNDHAMGMIG